MKVIYYSKSYFADCDFPLIKALQDKGMDVRYYMPLSRNFLRDNLIELDEPAHGCRFVKASKIKGFSKYSECIDLDRLYLIYGYPQKKFWPLTWIVWIYAVLHMLLQHPDIIHIDWPLKTCFEKLIYLIPWKAKKIVTVHDPVAHSGNYSSKDERERLRLFNWADELVLLNNKQENEFCTTYNITSNKIHFSTLGVYNSISKLKINNDYQIPKGKYILFFGYINKYKGLEYLLDAMIKVHEKCVDLTLVVAGGGNLYFDSTPFMKLNYVEWRNRYITNGELSALLKGCMFAVCPYTDATQSGVIQTAYSFNVPVIASNVGALADTVEDNITGMLVPACDSNELARSILKLYSSPNILEDMRRNIETQWLPKMSWSPIARQYINIYKDALCINEYIQ